MATRDIRTHTTVTVCDVCGRTLLRGERAEPYVSGAGRRLVCELCKSRALHEGWVREGTERAYPEPPGRDTRGSLLRRLRGGRERAITLGPAEVAGDGPGAPAGNGHAPPAGTGAEGRAGNGSVAPRPREPRHVRAVPTGAEQKCLRAMELFNHSEHRRTIAGVARSLGTPAVAVRAAAEHPSLVTLVLSWELCWYRYEVDLSEDDPEIRPQGRGYELSELEPWEREPNTLADERCELAPAR